MKVIFLNVWEAKLSKEITKFIEDQLSSTDIFCFQEANDEMKQIARRMLTDYTEIEKHKYETDNEDLPQATYIRKTITSINFGTVMENNKGIGLGLYAHISFGDKEFYICNFHGKPRPGDKLDDPGRLLQSEMLIDFFKDLNSPKIIGGDFNVLPNTRSIQMFRENGYRDLIKEYSVPTTRNQLVWSRYPDDKQYYSDYVFVSPEIKIKSFSVPNIEISDHLPLILEIE